MLFFACSAAHLIVVAPVAYWEFHVPVLLWALMANFPTIFFWNVYRILVSIVSHQEIGLHWT